MLSDSWCLIEWNDTHLLSNGSALKDLEAGLTFEGQWSFALSCPEGQRDTDSVFTVIGEYFLCLKQFNQLIDSACWH